MDKSTDISNCAQFVAFLRYNNNNIITENILFCTSLETNITGKYMFKIFIKSTDMYDIGWVKCITICTDGAKAMAEHQSAFITKLQEVMAKYYMATLFFTLKSFCVKYLPSEIDFVMKNVSKVVYSTNEKHFRLVFKKTVKRSVLYM